MKHFIRNSKEFIAGISSRCLVVYAASGCYYLFMSLVPIVMILCCLLPYTPFNQDMILQYMDQYFSESLGTIIRKIVSTVYDSNVTALTLSILLTLWSASASMRALMKGINAAYHFPETRNIVLFYIESLFFMILLVVSILLALGIMVYGGMILRIIRRYIPYITVFDSLLSHSRFLVIMGLLAIFFAFLYTWMPAKRVKLLQQIPGAVFASISWVLFSAVFSWYVSVSNKYGAFGIIGTLIVAMMWMNYCLLFLLIGGYINSMLKEKRERKHIPSQV